MITDEKDRFIVEHYKSMTQPEIADKLGINKSTVSRRVARLKAEGDISANAGETARNESTEARERLRGCAMDSTDRLMALAELKDALHAEIALSGGQSLARVSSEYRRTLEEIEALSAEITTDVNRVRRLDTVQAARMRHFLRDKYRTVCDADTVSSIIDSVLSWVSNLGLIEYTPLDSVLGMAAAYDEMETTEG